MSMTTDSPFVQKTIARSVRTTGVGIHSGHRTELKLLPAPEGTGVRFRRVDAGDIEIPALANYISSLELATTLGWEDVSVSTVEHLLAAVRLLGIDNLIVELDGPEVPILDGSALPYVRLLEMAGICHQGARRRILAVTSPLTLQEGGRSIRVSPYQGLRISYRIHFDNPAIGRQELDLVLDRTVFERELAPARTFALLANVRPMLKNGLGLGGSRGNCVLFDSRGPANTALRFPDEPVRHKALDAVGDLALLGAPLWGHVEVERGGHQIHCKLITALLESRDSWTWISGAVTPERWEARLPTRPPALASRPNPLDL